MKIRRVIEKLERFENMYGDKVAVSVRDRFGVIRQVKAVYGDNEEGKENEIVLDSGEDWVD